MVQLTRRMAVAGAFALAMGGPPALAQNQPIRIAFGDIATVETLNFLIAVERAKERGVEIEVTYFKSEDIAAQAVVLALAVARVLLGSDSVMKLPGGSVAATAGSRPSAAKSEIETTTGESNRFMVYSGRAPARRPVTSPKFTTCTA